MGTGSCPRDFATAPKPQVAAHLRLFVLRHTENHRNRFVAENIIRNAALAGAGLDRTKGHFSLGLVLLVRALEPRDKRVHGCFLCTEKWHVGACV